MNTSIENRLIWLNGEIVHLPDAKINVLSPIILLMFLGSVDFSGWRKVEDCRIMLNFVHGIDGYTAGASSSRISGQFRHCPI